MINYTKYYSFLITLALTLSLAHPSVSQSQSVGIFDGQGDVGDVKKSGNAVYQPKTQAYEISGAGENIWSDHDEFHFVWKRMQGDFILYTRAQFVGKGTDPHRKIGWMARRSLEANSPHVNAVVHGDGLTALQFRKTAGADTEEKRVELTGADVIQLERQGNTYTMRVARFGEPFVTTQVSNLELGKEVYVGLFVGSHNEDVIEKGVFNDVRITIPAGKAFQPYKQYLGSRLETLEVATGKREILHTEPGSIQAPNWMAGGKSLLYNGDGLIYTFDMDKRQPKVLNTGEVKTTITTMCFPLMERCWDSAAMCHRWVAPSFIRHPLKAGTLSKLRPKGLLTCMAGRQIAKIWYLQVNATMSTMYISCPLQGVKKSA